MKAIAILVAVAATAACGAFAGAYELGEELGREEFWKSDPVLFVRRHAESGFEFSSEQRDGANASTRLCPATSSGRFSTRCAGS